MSLRETARADPIAAVEVLLMVSCCLSGESPLGWATRHFAGVRLRDRRRTQRVVRLAQALASRPGASIPALFDDSYEIKAAYTLLSRSEATPEHLQAAHRDQVRHSLIEPGGTFLLIEDSTQLSWSGNGPVVGLGPIGDSASGLQGFLLHNTLAVRWPAPAPAEPAGHRSPLEIIGLADQQYHVRRPAPRHEPKGSGHARSKRWRESLLWSQTTERLGPAPAAVRWVRVCDREADIYEFLAGLSTAGHGFVVRAAQDRALVDEQGRPAGALFETLRQARPFVGSLALALRSRPGRKERIAQLKLAACPVRLRAPQRAGRAPGVDEPIACTALRIFETHPPAGEEALEWIVLTDQAVSDWETARQTALQYSARWLIEDFHKALKTGLGAERLQLETASRLFAAIAIMSVVALRLIDLRERVRLTPQAPAKDSGLSELELKILAARLKRRLQTVQEVALALGRLGGHMNRRRDGPPGWITLWRGMNQLHWLIQGFLLSNSAQQFGE
jgi:hypothetical protein